MGLLRRCVGAFTGHVFDLSDGKYVSLALWELMAATGLMVGPQGGRRLAYDKVDRYYNNSAFAGLVSEGWIRSRATRFEAMSDLLFEGYEAGRSIVYAALRLGNTRRRPGGRPELIRQPLTLDAR